MTLRLPDDDHDMLREVADVEGRSQQDVAQTAVHEYVQARVLTPKVDAAIERMLARYSGALKRLAEL